MATTLPLLAMTRQPVFGPLTSISHCEYLQATSLMLIASSSIPTLTMLQLAQVIEQ
jgi:hypothetical protein